MFEQLIRPPRLKKGDKVALIAPSGALLYPQRLDFAKKFLEDLELSAIVGQSCKSQYGYLAGDDDLRANDINWAFADKDIKGIFCIRGGYGAARILDMIDYHTIRNNPKFFAGYSDITALHTAINQKAGLMTYHMPMVCDGAFCKADEYTLDYFRKYIFSESIQGEIQNPAGRKWEFLSPGKGEGRLCGGNLSVLTSLLGTHYEPNTVGKIIFLEDVGEPPYRIDRMLTQLRLAGKFDGCAGVVFGDFADCDAANSENSLSISEIVNRLSLEVPVLFNFACGHCMPTASLPLGAMAAINSTANSFVLC